MDPKALIFFSLYIPFFVTLVQIFRGDKYSFIIPFLFVGIFQCGFFISTFPVKRFGFVFSIAACFLFYEIYKGIGFSRYLKKSYAEDERANKLFYLILAMMLSILLLLFYVSIRFYLIEQFGGFWAPFYFFIIFTLSLFFISIGNRKI